MARDSPRRRKVSAMKTPEKPPRPPLCLDRQFFLVPPRRQELLDEYGYFQIPLKEVSAFISNPVLSWFGRRQKQYRNTLADDANKQNQDPKKTKKIDKHPKKDMFHYVFGPMKHNPFKDEAVDFLCTQFEDEERQIANAAGMTGCYCQMVFAIIHYHNELPAHRIVVAVCLFHPMQEGLVFVSYIARYLLGYNHVKFCYQKLRQQEYTQFDHIGFERMFFHIAQVYTGIICGSKSDVPIPLWLQVSRNMVAAQTHKRHGLKETAISDLPLSLQPKGKGKKLLPLILNFKDQPFLHRQVTMRLDGKCHNVAGTVSVLLSSLMFILF